VSLWIELKVLGKLRRDSMKRLVTLFFLSSRRFNKKGFTLIELITVVGIIAILGVAIMPVLTGAKDKALQARYLSDCKTIISAVEIYNATITTDTEAIGNDTTIALVKNKLFENTDLNKRFLKNWPSKFPEALTGSDKKYVDIVNYISTLTNTSTTQVTSSNGS
jgi:type IV pilus assembly protein PilA